MVSDLKKLVGALVSGVFALVFVCLSFAGCRGEPENACPDTLEASPGPDSSAAWHSGFLTRPEGALSLSQRARANIVSVDAECLLESAPAGEPGQKGEWYAIAATAEIRITAADSLSIVDDFELWRASRKRWFATVIFEAKSSSGVVLASSQTKVTLARSGSTASAKIEGLSADAIRKVNRVEARWEYGP